MNLKILSCKYGVYTTNKIFIVHIKTSFFCARMQSFMVDKGFRINKQELQHEKLWWLQTL